jgi:hypothetical protein
MAKSGCARCCSQRCSCASVLHRCPAALAAAWLAACRNVAGGLACSNVYVAKYRRAAAYSVATRLFHLHNNGDNICSVHFSAQKVALLLCTHIRTFIPTVPPVARRIHPLHHHCCLTTRPVVAHVQCSHCCACRLGCLIVNNTATLHQCNASMQSSRQSGTGRMGPGQTAMELSQH